jgi:hypothetical protein
MFDNVLLVTSGDGLSMQHLKELEESGLPSGFLIENRTTPAGLFGPMVKVIEIHKLADEPSKDGESIILEELGGRNLVIVDEGHKGTGSEAKAWKTKQRTLSEDGFLLEYSATFSQAIGAASRKLQEDLLSEYGKAIAFDYSYAHFYGDGYGKNFRVLNLQRARARQAHELMLGGLLVYYSQLELYRNHEAHFREFKIERPLWVLLGTSVSRKKGDKSLAAETERTDVAEVLAFIRAFLEDPEWAQETIGRLVSGESGHRDEETGEDLFARHLELLKRSRPAELYRSLQQSVFHGRGALELWEIRGAEGEIGLRVSTAAGTRQPFFGVINIGDVPDFRKHIKDKLGLEVQEEHFAGSLFGEVDQPASAVNVLIGAKKFIEGWSSWRVSSMGLMNVGKGEGSQVMQLFGRGVRLKGREMSLKRSEACRDISEDAKKLNQSLETLYIFGWNADYVERFREMLTREDIGRHEFRVKVARMKPWPNRVLNVPVPKAGFDLESLTWELEPGQSEVTMDLTPRMAALWSASKDDVHTAGDSSVREVCLGDDDLLGLVDLDRVYADLLEHKRKANGNVFVSRAVMEPVLKSCRVTLREEDSRDPAYVQSVASRAVIAYFDDWVRRREREAEFESSEPGWLARDAAGFEEYTVRVKEGRFLREIERLLKKQPLQPGQADDILPRLHWDRSLYNPVLAVGGKEWAENVAVQPPPLSGDERRLLEDLKGFWQKNHNKEQYRGLDIYVLRNLPGQGIGLFSRSGFYPDFVVWLKNRGTAAIHVRFLDPHGLHHDGLSGTKPKFDALRKLAEFSVRDDFRSKSISLDGYILSRTKLEHIVDRGDRQWSDIEREYPVVRQEADYIRRVLDVP